MGRVSNNYFKPFGKKNTWLFLFLLFFSAALSLQGKKMQSERLRINTQSSLMAGTPDGRSSPETSLTGYGFFHFWELFSSFSVTDYPILRLENIQCSQWFPDGTIYMPVQKLFRECLNWKTFPFPVVCFRQNSKHYLN